MIFYSVLYFLVLFFLVFDFIEISLGLKKTFLILLIMIFSVVVGVSDNIGIDIAEYKEIYDDSPILNDFIFGSYYKESGYILLNSFIKTYFDNFNILLTLITVFNFLILYKVLINEKFEKFMFFSFYIYITGYLFVGMFNQLRQQIIMSLFLLSILLILNNQKIRYIILILFSMLFHRISAIYLIFMGGYRKNITPLFYMYIFLISIGIGLSGMLYTSTINTISYFSSPEIQDVLLKIKGYYLAELNKSMINLAFFEKLFLFGVVLYFYKKLLEVNYLNYILINIFFINIFLYMILIQDLQLAGRISKVFKIVEVLLIPQLFLMDINRILKHIVFLFFILLGALHYYKELFRNLEYFIPYQTVLGG